MFALNRRIGQIYILPKFNGQQVKEQHSNAQILTSISEVKNKNPRNLELLRIARKPAGRHLEKPGREYWHKLIVTKTLRHVTAEVIHWENKAVISASTREWAIKKQLFKLQDRSAYLNLGRVLAQRCLESGITHVRCDIEPSKCEKLTLLLNEIKNGGISLEEPTRYVHSAPWDQHRYQKPWEVED